MAVRTAGTRLIIEQLSSYISGMNSATRANVQFRDSLRNAGLGDVGRAVQDAERRATAAVRGEISIRTSMARAEATERAQAARAAAASTIEAERRATAAFRSELSQRAAAQRSATPVPRAGVGGGIGGAVVGGIAAFATIETARFITDQAVIGANNARLAASFAELAAGINLSADSLRNGLRQAVQGTVTDQKLMASTNLILSSAQDGNIRVTEQQIETLARFARLRSTQLPNLTTEDAFSRLTTGIVKRETELLDELGLSTKGIADQLGIDVSEVNKDVNSLLEGVVKVANIEIERFGDPVVDDATRIEQSFTSIENSFNKMRGALAQPVAVVLNIVAGAVSGTVGAVSQTDLLRQTVFGGLDLSEARQRIAQQVNPVDIGPRIEQGIGGLLGNEVNAEQLNKLLGVIDQFDAAVANGAGNLKEYESALLAIAQAAAHDGELTAAQVGQLYELDLIVQQAAAGYDDLTQAQQRSAEAAEVQAFADARQQIDELAKTSLELFRQGIPGAEELANEIIEMQTALASSTELTDKDRAALLELEQAHRLTAAAAGQSIGGLDAAAQAKLNDQVAALQDAQANQTLAASLQAVAAAQAGVSRGVVGNISGLIGGGLINPSQAGALNQFVQRQATAGFADIRSRGLTGDALTFATADLNRQITAPFRELEAIETRMTREAQEQHRSAQGASKEWNKAQKDAEKAAQATRKALEGVEGLFSPSKVTQQQLDIAAAGGAVNLPDDFLRRFRDVSENFDEKGFRGDFGQQQLDEARAALQRIGVQPLEDLKGLFAQFEEAWSNLSLFSDKENLSLINQQAVQDQLALQAKMEQGRKNIYELFGVAIDDATEAVTGGGGGVPPIDMEALQERIFAAQQQFIDSILSAGGFNSSGVSLSDRVRSGPDVGVVGDAFTSLSDHVRSSGTDVQESFGETVSTADILRETFGRTTEAAEVLATKINDIPPIIWEDHIEEFPNWSGEEGEGLIPPFPGWEHWLGSPGVDTGPADMGSTAPAPDTVPSVQSQMTQPAPSTTNNVRTSSVTINSNQSTGSLVTDWAILQAQGRV